MKTLVQTPNATRLVLKAKTAAELMTPNPISISETATLKEAVAVLVDSGFSAVPVVDGAGRPVGVVSQTDIVIHARNKTANLDHTLARDIMTLAVLSVTPQDSAIRVIGEMVAFMMHRLFVVDSDGILVGVISAFDILRKLYAEK